MIDSNLYKRDGIWYLRIQINGFDLRRTLRTKSKAEARERAAFLIKKATTPIPAHPTGARVRREALIKTLARHTKVTARGNFIYFIQRSDGGPIKIGRSLRPNARVAIIQRDHPLPLLLLCSVPAPADYETVIHKRFAKDRLGGEWFTPTPRLYKFIRELIAAKSAPAHSPATGDRFADTGQDATA